MKKLLSLSLVLLAMALPALAQQRIEFQRQKFDRSRFDRPSAAVHPSLPSVPSRAPVAPPPPPPPSAPAPMVTAPAEPFAPPSAAGEFAPPRPPADRPLDPAAAALAELAAAPKFDLVPKKWFDRARDLETAKALQAESGACILLYFVNMTDSSQKGLCSWFEKEAASFQRWRKAMPLYIKVKIVIAGGDARTLAEQYNVKSTPAVFVLSPGGKFPKRVSVFEWPGGEPKPCKQDELMQHLIDASSPAYRDIL